MSLVIEKDIKQVLKAVKTKSLVTEVENFIIALKMMGYEINVRIGTWDLKTKEVEYALLINDTDYRSEYVRNKISFVFKFNKFEKFVVRVQNKFFDIKKMNDVMWESEECSFIYDKDQEFILNCTNKKLIKGILAILLKCVR